MNKRKKPVWYMLLIFMFLNIFFITQKNILAKWGIDNEVMIVANLLLFIVSLIAFLITKRSLASPNPQAFIRAMYGSFIIKFFVVAIAAFVYIMVAKKNVSKAAVFASMGLYVVYTSIEIGALMKLLKQKKDA